MSSVMQDVTCRAELEIEMSALLWNLLVYTKTCPDSFLSLPGKWNWVGKLQELSREKKAIIEAGGHNLTKTQRDLSLEKVKV